MVTLTENERVKNEKNSNIHTNNGNKSICYE